MDDEGLSAASLTKAPVAHISGEGSLEHRGVYMSQNKINLGGKQTLGRTKNSPTHSLNWVQI